MDEKLVQAGEIRMQVRDYPRDGEAVIFLHFGGGNMHMWRDVVPFFTDDYRVVLADLRGHGRSDKPPGGYHIDRMAQDVVGVMDTLGISAAHLVGSSLGSEVGLSLAANYPKQALSLVCEGALFNEGGPYGIYEGNAEAFTAHARKTLRELEARDEKTYPSVDAMVEESACCFGEMGWWNDVFASVVRHDAIETDDGHYVKSWDRIALPYMRHALYYNFGDYYARVRCPVLLMPDTFPGQDEVQLDIMARLFALIQDGRIVRVKDWVHPFGWMLMPESGSKAVLQFLQDI